MRGPFARQLEMAYKAQAGPWLAPEEDLLNASTFILWRLRVTKRVRYSLQF
jgi:hypothetical protein